MPSHVLQNMSNLKYESKLSVIDIKSLTLGFADYIWCKKEPLTASPTFRRSSTSWTSLQPPFRRDVWPLTLWTFLFENQLINFSSTNKNREIRMLYTYRVQLTWILDILLFYPLKAVYWKQEKRFTDKQRKKDLREFHSKMR